METQGPANADTGTGTGTGAGTSDAEPPGILIPWVRRYNLLVTVIFGGRRGALNTTLVAASGARPGDRVLDVGSGPGILAGRLAAAVGPGGLVVGVDPSAPMVEYASRHAGRAANCRFELSSAQAMDLPYREFDVVTSTFAMHHIPEEHRGTALAQMYRVLRPGGRLLIADAFPSGPVTPRVTRAMARLMSYGGGGHHGGHGAHDASHGTDPLSVADVRQYTGALRAAGFSEPRFTDVRPWTRYLVADKPGAV